MLYTELTKKAIRICFNAHCTENDKGETPYVFHPFHLAEQMETEEETCAALLHDVVEDTNMGFADLEAEGFPKSVVDALRLLTHDEKTDYMGYVKALSGNRIAARVKLADLRHNSTAGRLPFIGDNERKRMGKYLEAQAILTGGEYNLEEMTLSLRYRIPLSDRLDIRERRYGLNTAEDLHGQKTGVDLYGQDDGKTCPDRPSEKACRQSPLRSQLSWNRTDGSADISWYFRQKDGKGTIGSFIPLWKIWSSTGIQLLMPYRAFETARAARGIWCHKQYMTGQ